MPATVAEGETRLSIAVSFSVPRIVSFERTGARDQRPAGRGAVSTWKTTGPWVVNWTWFWSVTPGISTGGLAAREGAATTAARRPAIKILRRTTRFQASRSPGTTHLQSGAGYGGRRGGPDHTRLRAAPEARSARGRPGPGVTRNSGRRDSWSARTERSRQDDARQDPRDGADPDLGARTRARPRRRHRHQGRPAPDRDRLRRGARSLLAPD